MGGREGGREGEIVEGEGLLEGWQGVEKKGGRKEEERRIDKKNR